MKKTRIVIGFFIMFIWATSAFSSPAEETIACHISCASCVKIEKFAKEITTNDTEKQREVIVDFLVPCPELEPNPFQHSVRLLHHDRQSDTYRVKFGLYCTRNIREPRLVREIEVDIKGEENYYLLFLE